MKYNANDYEIMYMIRENDENAYGYMYDKYRPVVLSLVNKYYPLVEGKITFDDMIQEGMIGVSNAIRTFNEYGNVLFYTYLSVCVERYLLTFCRNVNSRKHHFLNNSYRDEFLENRPNEFDSCLNTIIMEESFLEIKNSLEFLDSNIFELKYNGFTNSEIANLLDITIGYVQYRICRMRKILKLNKKLFI